MRTNTCWTKPPKKVKTKTTNLSKCSSVAPVCNAQNLKESHTAPCPPKDPFGSELTHEVKAPARFLSSLWIAFSPVSWRGRWISTWWLPRDMDMDVFCVASTRADSAQLSLSLGLFAFLVFSHFPFQTNQWDQPKGFRFGRNTGPSPKATNHVLTDVSSRLSAGMLKVAWLVVQLPALSIAVVHRSGGVCARNAIPT